MWLCSSGTAHDYFATGQAGPSIWSRNDALGTSRRAPYTWIRLPPARGEGVTEQAEAHRRHWRQGWAHASSGHAHPRPARAIQHPSATGAAPSRVHGTDPREPVRGREEALAAGRQAGLLTSFPLLRLPRPRRRQWSVPPGSLWEGYGSTEEEYLALGREHMASMLDILRKAGASVEAFQRVMDFGCAAGRMLRFFPFPRGGRSRPGGWISRRTRSAGASSTSARRSCSVRIPPLLTCPSRTTISTSSTRGPSSRTSPTCRMRGSWSCAASCARAATRTSPSRTGMPSACCSGSSRTGSTRISPGSSTCSPLR